RRVVACTEATLQNTSVTTGTARETRAQFVKQFCHDLVITSTGECQTTISNAISLGKSNQRLNYAAQLFRFRQSRLDDFMTNQ
ncbi:hypothetical protein ECPA23_4463, partial [Escherichia coli PA23]